MKFTQAHADQLADRLEALTRPRPVGTKDTMAYLNIEDAECQQILIELSRFTVDDEVRQLVAEVKAWESDIQEARRRILAS